MVLRAGSFTQGSGGGGGGATIPSTSNLIKGDGAGNGADSGIGVAGNGLILPQQSAPTYQRGKLVYDTDNESLTFFNNDSNVGLQVGQEEWVRVYNATGSSIANGAAVLIGAPNVAQPTLPTITLAQANNVTSAAAIGIATETIATGSIGYVTRSGIIHGVNTAAYSAGAILYLSTATPGALTTIIPTSTTTAVTYAVPVGRVVVSDATVGSIEAMPPVAQVSAGPDGTLPQYVSGAPTYTNTPTLLSNAYNVSVATPAAGYVTMYPRTKASKTLVNIMDQYGQAAPIQPHLALDRSIMCTFGYAATTVSSFGITTANIGTPAGESLGTTSMYLAQPRVGYNTGTTAGTAGGLRSSGGTNSVYRGSIANTGGFYFVMRFGITIPASGTSIGFFGLSNGGTGAPSATANPTTKGSTIGAYYNLGDTTFSIMCNGTSLNTVALGASFPADTTATAFYELRLYAPPNGTFIGWYIERIDTGDRADGQFTTGLMSQTIAMSPMGYVSNVATAAAVQCALFNKWYIGSDL